MCNGVGPSTAATLPASANTYKSIILLDSVRLPGYTPALRTQIDTFAARSDVNGAVVDLAGDARITALNAQADGKPACVYAKNLVAESIRDLVLRYRTANSTLANVVLIGGDDVIPFFRSPDQASLAPESGFVPPVSSNSASEASLRNNYVLSQDAYGAGTQISLYSSTFPIPELAVGRLVETASEISGMLTAYTATNGVVTPGSSLVTGYDFLDDAATLAQSLLTGGTGATPGTPAGDSLITPFNKAPSDPASWTAAQLKTKMLGTRHDVVFLAGHFSANSALAADYATSMTTADLVGSALDQSNVLVLSIGCHSGYNMLDSAAVAGVTDPLDWAQALARKKMTGVLGTGYQYGDTEFLEYSERIYTEIARRLRYGTGPVSIGQALVAAKLDYLKETPDIRDLHEKALRQTTLYGLPMMRFDMPQGRGLSDPSAGTISGTTGFPSVPGSALGLQSAELTVNPSLTEKHKTLSILGGGTLNTTYYQGGAGVVSNPGEPAIPLESIGVGKSGYVLRGIGFVEGTYTDGPVVPLSGAPATELKTAHTPFTSPTFFPSRMWTPNYIEALTPGGNGTRLLVTPAQHKATNPGDETVTLRKYSNMKLKLYYSNSTAPGAGSAAPSISDVGTTVVGSRRDLPGACRRRPARWHPGSLGHLHGPRQPMAIHRPDAEHHGLVPVDEDRRAVGRLSHPDRLHRPGRQWLRARWRQRRRRGVPPDVRRDQHPAGARPRSALASSPTSGVYGGSATVTATLSPAASGKVISFSIGGVVRSATTNGSGVASVAVPLTFRPASSRCRRVSPATSRRCRVAMRDVHDREGADLVDAGTDLARPRCCSVPTAASPRPSRRAAAPGPRSPIARLLRPERPADADHHGHHRLRRPGQTRDLPAGWRDLHGHGVLQRPVDSIGVLRAVRGRPDVRIVRCDHDRQAHLAMDRVPLPGRQPRGPQRREGREHDPGEVQPWRRPRPRHPGRRIPEDRAADVPEQHHAGQLDRGDLARSGGLTFSDGRYQWNWKTPKTYAGKCYRLDVILIDGTTHSASFRFK